MPSDPPHGEFAAVVVGLSLALLAVGPAAGHGAAAGPRESRDVELVSAGTLGGTGWEHPGGFARAGDGSLLLSGGFGESVDFDPGPGVFTLESTGRDDAFVVKLGADGALAWAVQFSGPEDVFAFAVAADAAGDVFVGGGFEGTVDFDPGPGVVELTAPYPYQVPYLAKLGVGGELLWVRTLGARGQITGLAVAPDGGVVAGGLSTTSGGTSFASLTKVTSSGDDEWAHTFGTVGGTAVRGVAIDGAGNVFAVGEFFGAVDFDPGAGVYRLQAETTDAYALSLDSTGGFRWAGRIGGAGFNYGLGVAADASGVVLVGSIFGPADLDPGDGVYPVWADGWDGFIVALDPAGTFRWGRLMGGYGSDSLNTVVLDASGEPIAAGTFSWAVDFDPGPGQFQRFAYPGDAVYWKLGVNGDLRWMAQLRSASEGTGGSGVAAGGPGEVYGFGTFWGAADLDPGTGELPVTSVGDHADLFVVHLAEVSGPPERIQVPAQVATIQGALDVAHRLDTIVVAPGVYRENLDFKGQHVTLESRDGPEAIVIDGGGEGSVFSFHRGEGRSAVVEGFTIRDGYRVTGGGGGGFSLIAGSSPTIQGNWIEDNIGGGIVNDLGGPLIRGNLIRRNVGGGIYNKVGAVQLDASPEILDNRIEGNTSGRGAGIYFFGAGHSRVEGNRIVGNEASIEGGGIYWVNRGGGVVAQNLVVGNRAAQRGGAFSWFLSSSSAPMLVIGNTLADNVADEGTALYADGFDGLVSLVDNLLVGPEGASPVFCGDFTIVLPQFVANDAFSLGAAPYDGICPDPTGENGNLSVDPLFIDPAGGDFHLTAHSPVIDAGVDPAGALPPTDIDGDKRVIDGDGDGLAEIDLGVDERCVAGCPLFADGFESGGLDAWTTAVP